MNTENKCYSFLRLLIVSLLSLKRISTANLVDIKGKPAHHELVSLFRCEEYRWTSIPVAIAAWATIPTRDSKGLRTETICLSFIYIYSLSLTRMSV